MLRDTGKSPGTTSIPAERLKVEVTSRRAGAELSGGGALPTQLSCKPSPLAPRFLPTTSVQISAHIFSSPQVCIGLCISIHPHLTLLYVPAVKISASLPSGQGNEIPPLSMGLGAWEGVPFPVTAQTISPCGPLCVYGVLGKLFISTCICNAEWDVSCRTLLTK